MRNSPPLTLEPPAGLAGTTKSWTLSPVRIETVWCPGELATVALICIAATPCSLTRGLTYKASRRAAPTFANKMPHTGPSG